MADADGPDGQSDGIIAYNEQTDKIKGKKGPVLEQEHWNNNLEDYIDEEDVPNLKCPGDTIRCLISIDITTKPDDGLHYQETINKTHSK